jgi:hypothetical protein
MKWIRTTKKYISLWWEYLGWEGITLLIIMLGSMAITILVVFLIPLAVIVTIIYCLING